MTIGHETRFWIVCDGAQKLTTYVEDECERVGPQATSLDEMIEEAESRGWRSTSRVSASVEPVGTSLRMYMLALCPMCADKVQTKVANELLRKRCGIRVGDWVEFSTAEPRSRGKVVGFEDRGGELCSVAVVDNHDGSFRARSFWPTVHCHVIRRRQFRKEEQA